MFSAGLLVLIGCGSGGGSSGGSSAPVNNTQAVQVNLGPANNSTNEAFVAVTVCVPGSSNCQTIENVEVDTGSEGLRLLSGQVSLSLPAVADTSGNALQECVSFADLSYVWGPVVSADIQMAGEKATSVPIQIVSASPAFPVPSNCISGAGATDDNTIAALGANGILGLGVFPTGLRRRVHVRFHPSPGHVLSLSQLGLPGCAGAPGTASEPSLVLSAGQ
jgi:hypothetical protein